MGTQLNKARSLAKAELEIRRRPTFIVGIQPDHFRNGSHIAKECVIATTVGSVTLVLSSSECSKRNGKFI